MEIKLMIPEQVPLELQSLLNVQSNSKHEDPLYPTLHLH
jgi:hypothetical protein